MRNLLLTRNEAEILVDALQTCPAKDDPGVYELEDEIRVLFGMVSRAEEDRVKTSFAHFQTIEYPGMFREWYQKQYPDPLPHRAAEDAKTPETN